MVRRPRIILGHAGQEIVPRARGSVSGEAEPRRGPALVREPATVGRPDARSARYLLLVGDDVSRKSDQCVKREH
jgi:hypothetical protein